MGETREEYTSRPDREPGVLERMARAYELEMTSMMGKVDHLTPEQIGDAAMLSAVRELRQAHWEYEDRQQQDAVESGQAYMALSAYAFLLHVVSNHEVGQMMIPPTFRAPE